MEAILMLPSAFEQLLAPGTTSLYHVRYGMMMLFVMIAIEAAATV